MDPCRWGRCGCATCPHIEEHLEQWCALPSVMQKFQDVSFPGAPKTARLDGALSPVQGRVYFVNHRQMKCEAIFS